MEFQECGRVLDVRGGPREGFWYAVLVDGSDTPILFPEKSLGRDEAGAVVSPVPEPIEDEQSEA
jgi:hypothetical protein